MELSAKAVEIALICVDSFNFDKSDLQNTLAKPEEASVLI